MGFIVDCLQSLGYSVDEAAEGQRSAKRREELTKQIAAMKGRLSNESYTAKAPPHLVQQTRDQLAELTRWLESVEYEHLDFEAKIKLELKRDKSGGGCG